MVKKYIVEEVAHRLVINEKSSLPRAEVDACISTALQSFPEWRDCDVSSVRRDIVERSGLLRPSGRDGIDFVHNSLKEYLAANRLVSLGDIDSLVSNPLDDTWQPVLLFAAALPNPDFATKLFDRLCKTNHGLREAIRRSGKDLEGLSPHQLELERFMLRFRSSAFRLDEKTVTLLDNRISGMLPPKRIEDAPIIAALGNSVIRFLTKSRTENARQRLSAIRTLGLIGGEQANRALTEYCDEESSEVLGELLAALDWPGLDRLRPIVDESAGRGHASAVNDISMLAKFPGIQELDISRTAVVDLTVVSSLPRIHSLTLASTDVSNISPVRNLTNLRKVVANHTLIADLSPLKHLSQLEVLDVAYSPVSDIQPIAESSSLESLDCRFCPLVRIPRMNGCRNLKFINLGGTLVKDVSALSKLRSLQHAILPVTASQKSIELLRRALPNCKIRQ
ncbi:MAG: hypothetical protein R3C18_18705 [Planctomycetaceae bacterium]